MSSPLRFWTGLAFTFIARLTYLEVSQSLQMPWSQILYTLGSCCLIGCVVEGILRIGCLDQWLGVLVAQVVLSSGAFSLLLFFGTRLLKDGGSAVFMSEVLFWIICVLVGYGTSAFLLRPKLAATEQLT